MYSNEMLRTKIVGQPGGRAIVWQERTGVQAAKGQIRKKRQQCSQNAKLKAVRRVPAARAGQGLPLRLCAFCGS